jgi:hypothetical protein
MQAWADSSETVYPDPPCEHCGSTLKSYDNEKHSEYEGEGCADFACESCKKHFDNSDFFDCEPSGWKVEDSEYLLTDCLDSDIFVLKAPYYTFAPFCSPCVPGAGNLNGADMESDESNGVKVYALGHDWFESGVAPYALWSVETGERVEPTK